MQKSQKSQKSRGTFYDDGIMLGYLPDESPKDREIWSGMSPFVKSEPDLIPTINEEAIINKIKTEIVTEFGRDAVFLTWYVPRGTKISQTIVEQIKEIDNKLNATVEYYDEEDAGNEVLIVSSQNLDTGSNVLEFIRRSMRERIQRVGLQI